MTTIGRCPNGVGLSPGPFIAAAIAVAATAVVPTPSAAQLTVQFRGMVDLPTTAKDQFGQTFTVTGLSGVTFRGPAETDFLAVMDNSNKLVRLSVTVNADGSIASAAIPGGITLSDTRDFEGVAMNVESGGNNVFVSEEGTPAVHDFHLATGERVRTFATPPVFLTRRSNFGFESLTRTIGGDLWTANEEALTADGPLSSPTAGTVVRLLKLTNFGVTRSATFQYAYLTDPWHGSAVTSARGGLCDLVILRDGQMLALERSWSLSASGLFRSRIYEVNLAGATDVRDFSDGLIGKSYTPAGKRLLWEGFLGNNLEGLCVGRVLSPSSYSLIGIVDDGDPLSVNKLVAWEVGGFLPLPPPPPRPPCYANCTDDTGPDGRGLLDIRDFVCFQNKVVLRDPYADCNADSSIDVRDFTCFQNAFALGCP